jgi:hypothetical protein
LKNPWRNFMIGLQRKIIMRHCREILHPSLGVEWGDLHIPWHFTTLMKSHKYLHCCLPYEMQSREGFIGSEVGSLAVLDVRLLFITLTVTSCWFLWHFLYVYAERLQKFLNQSMKNFKLLLIDLSTQNIFPCPCHFKLIKV